MPEDSSWAMEVHGLVKRFGDFVAVDRVSFQVKKGEIFGFLGPNGAGKSTVIRMLCGLLTPTSGSATVAGFDVARQPEMVRTRLGYMSQKFSLYDDLTVEENIQFFSGIYGVPKNKRDERRDYVLRLAGLEDKRHTTTGQLAGGWKQRLALGCAIIHEPPVLFLDEPTSGVDPIARRGFWDLIYQLSAAGRTVFVSTHYMDEAEYCHRLALMYAGRIIALGVPEALRKEMSAHRLLRLETPDVLAGMKALENDSEILNATLFGGGLQLAVRDADSGAARVRKVMEANHLSIESLTPAEASMEDVFVTLIEAEEMKSA